jgi:hypothetical protein
VGLPLSNARGTLGGDRDIPVGLTDIALRFGLDTDADAATVQRLVEMSERVLRHLSDKGLPALHEADAAFFFGREDETATILDVLAERPDRIIALMGQSGVGKSSLARADVVARLKSQAWPQAAGNWLAGRLRDSRTLLSLVLRPGEQPLKELALAFQLLSHRDRFPTLGRMHQVRRHARFS